MCAGPDPIELAELYADAVALVHPSLYEGFGLTPLEAMGLGAPVIAAHAPGTVETCGDAARYADPHDPEAFAAAMLDVSGIGQCGMSSGGGAASGSARSPGQPAHAGMSMPTL